MENKIQGFGDLVEKFTKLTGIKKAVDTVSKVTKKDCGCQKRKEALNKKFPFYNK